MRQWGFIVTAFYALAVFVLAGPGMVYLVSGPLNPDLREWLHEYDVWLAIGIAVSGQALLLFLSVDTSRKRLRPRAHALVSCSIAAMFLAILTFAAMLSLVYGIFGEHRGDSIFGGWTRSSWFGILGFWAGLWLFWGIVFHRYSRDSPNAVTEAVSWLLKGSILELLVAVPCHVIVRHRKDCSAPIATSFGITTGIAVMLLSFGPSVLFLYKKRVDARSTTAHRTTSGNAHPHKSR